MRIPSAIERRLPLGASQIHGVSCVSAGLRHAILADVLNVAAIRRRQLLNLEPSTPSHLRFIKPEPETLKAKFQA